jgi:AcrR family transcriptional regulator
MSSTTGKRSDKPTPGTTRERIVDEAMRLFSEHGYTATSIAKIEAAVGLTPGAGGIYHHFASKEAVRASSRDSGRSARSGTCSGRWETSEPN